MYTCTDRDQERGGGAGLGAGHNELMRILSQGERREDMAVENSHEVERLELLENNQPQGGPGAAPQFPLPVPRVVPPPQCTVPFISEQSGLSSDEDMMGQSRIRRGRTSEEESRCLPPSTLIHSLSAPLKNQELTQSESSSDEIVGVVPDPEMMRRLELQRANRTPAKVPKIPSQLKKSMVRQTSRLATCSVTCTCVCASSYMYVCTCTCIYTNVHVHVHVHSTRTLPSSSLAYTVYMYMYKFYSL